MAIDRTESNPNERECATTTTAIDVPIDARTRERETIETSRVVW